MLEIRFSSNEIMRDVVKAIQATPEYVSHGVVINDKENCMIIGKNNINHVVIDFSKELMHKHDKPFTKRTTWYIHK